MNTLATVLIILKSFRRYFHLHASTIIALLIIGLVGFLSVSWFRGDYLISALDFSMPFNRIRSFLANFYSWDSRSLGSANPRIIAFTFPVWTYFAFSEIIGLSLANTEKILFYGIFAISGLSMYYLTTTLISTKTFKFKHLAGLISGLFYMLNPYVSLNIMPLRQVAYIVYALLPLILGVFIKGLNEKRTVTSAVSVAFVMLLATSAYVDPSFVPLTLLPLLMYFIFFALINPEKTVLFSAFKFTLIFAITWMLLNLYWLVPDLNSYSYELEQVAGAYSSVGWSFQSIVQLNSAPMLGAVRLLGLWILNSGYKGDPYVIWAPAYQNVPLIAVSFLIPVLAFTPALLKPKDKHVLFFTSFAIISLLLVNGSYSTLGNWIYSYIPLFAAFFNQPYERFGMYVTLAYAFLIGYVLAKLFDCLSSHLKQTGILRRHIVRGFPIVLLLFLIVGVYAFPLWTGDVIRPDTTVLKSNRYQIPAYYNNASDWLKADQSDFNILVLPMSKIGYAELDWPNGGYDGPYPAEWLFPKPVIPSTRAGNGVAEQAAELIVENSTTAAGNMLALMNVKYILFHGDTNWQYLNNNPSWIPTSAEPLQMILNYSTAFSLEKTFGQLDFYRNNYWSPMHIYTATNSILIDGGLNQTTKILERNDFKPGESVLLLSNLLNAQQISALPVNTIFLQNQNLNLTQDVVTTVLNKGRTVCAIDFPPFTTTRYYSEWKNVISTNGQGTPDMLILQSPRVCSYIEAFPKNLTSWNACNSTLVYIVTDDNPLRIDQILTDGNPTSDIIGVWWENDWMGMNTKPVTYPIIIPPHQKAIMQINHKADAVTLKTNPPQIENMILSSLKDDEDFADANNLLTPNQTGNTSITYEKINPTKYAVNVNASQLFYLVFSESYHADWIAYIDGQQVPNEYHFTANGFANGWYINKTGTYTITLEFWPQKLFYTGSAISVTTLILCALYVSKDKIKIMFQKIHRNKTSRKD